MGLLAYDFRIGPRLGFASAPRPRTAVLVCLGSALHVRTVDDVHLVPSFLNRSYGLAPAPW